MFIPYPGVYQTKRIEDIWQGEVVQQLHSSSRMIFPYLLKPCQAHLLKTVPTGSVFFCESYLAQGSLDVPLEQMLKSQYVFTTHPVSSDYFCLPYWLSYDFINARNLHTADKIRNIFFMGYLGSNPIRVQLADFLARTQGEHVLICNTAYVPTSESQIVYALTPSVTVGIASSVTLKDVYVEHMIIHSHAFCPAGDQPSTRRIYEALACGTNPVIIGQEEYTVPRSLLPYVSLVELSALPSIINAFNEAHEAVADTAPYELFETCPPPNVIPVDESPVSHRKDTEHERRNEFDQRLADACVVTHKPSVLRKVYNRCSHLNLSSFIETEILLRAGI